MRRLIVYNHISLDGYFVDTQGNMDWAHNSKEDEEWNKFMEKNAQGGGVLIFGRITYDLMAGFWPTKYAAETMPLVAERMNNLPKVVISKTMDEASWNNTLLIKENLVSEIKKMKNESGVDMVIMGSGTIISQLTNEHLIDEYQIVVVPVILGSGRTMFGELDEKFSLELVSSRSFQNGNLLLCYKPCI